MTCSHWLWVCAWQRGRPQLSACMIVDQNTLKCCKCMTTARVCCPLTGFTLAVYDSAIMVSLHHFIIICGMAGDPMGNL